MNEDNLSENEEKRLKLLDLFSKIEKDENSSLTIEEGRDFLTNNGILSDNILNEIISSIYSKNNILTINEFINNFILFYHSIKEKFHGDTNFIDEKNKRITDIQNKTKIYEDELLNENEISTNSILKIELKECEILNKDNAFYLFKLFMNNIIFSTESFQGALNHFQNVKFEFKLNSKYDILNIQLFRIEDNQKNETELYVETMLNINNFHTNEEFEYLIELKNEENKIFAKLTSNITIIFSYLEYYNNLLKLEKDDLSKYSNNKTILLQLDRIFLKKNINNESDNNNENNNNESENNNENNNNEINNNNNNLPLINFEINEIDPEIRMRDRNNIILDRMKEIQNLREIGMNITMSDIQAFIILSLICISNSFFQSFFRNDFISAIIAALLIFSVLIATKFLFYLQIIISISIIYDIFWFIYINKVFNNFENVSQIFSFLFFLANIIIKSFFLLGLDDKLNN